MIETCRKLITEVCKAKNGPKDRRIGRYELIRTIGHGTFAKVKLGRNVETGKDVAIKILEKHRVLKDGKMEQVKREISIMKLLKHPNVVELYEVMGSKSKIYLVMEYLAGGELSDVIDYQTRLEEEDARIYFQQLISALDFCHSRGVCHRDLKPRNLLLDSHGNVKIGDFGLSALLDLRRQDGLLHTTCGTATYAAPEVWFKKGYDGRKADLWSCGVILFVLLAGYEPFNDQNFSKLHRKNNSSRDFKCPTWFSPQVKIILHGLLESDPLIRMSMEELKDSNWFRNSIPRRPKECITNADDHKMDVQVVDLINGHEDGKYNPSFLNAFELISMCPGLDLSGLIEQEKELKHHGSRFTSKSSASEIISKLEQIAEDYGLMMKRRQCRIKMQGTHLVIVGQVFEVAPWLMLVELRMIEGDGLEYERFYHQKLKPTLQQIVWTWTNF